ncbi:hypothetical protein GW17_00017999 [Ensete ventricosum]|nr:hypothetical protein GW17_00017999 [Ensete ventricosum]
MSQITEGTRIRRCRVPTRAWERVLFWCEFPAMERVDEVVFRWNVDAWFPDTNKSEWTSCKIGGLEDDPGPPSISYDVRPLMKADEKILEDFNVPVESDVAWFKVGGEGTDVTKQACNGLPKPIGRRGQNRGGNKRRGQRRQEERGKENGRVIGRKRDGRQKYQREEAITAVRGGGLWLAARRRRFGRRCRPPQQRKC